MAMKFLCKMKNKINKKRGMSTVVASLMLILLTLVLVGILWTVIQNMVNSKLDQSQSCMNILGKISINNQYTCYNQTTKELQFSISISDIKVDSVVVAISGGAQTKSLSISNQNKTINYLRPYKGAYSDLVNLPGENEGLTYIYNMTGAGFSNSADQIELAPVVNGKQCDASDSSTQIMNC